MILVIVGPTAVGKTRLSIDLAKLYNGEIINADSMQIYKELNVGTAKVTNKEMEHIPHHLLSIKEVDETYSVFDYQKDARVAIDTIKQKNKIPILVGGTGFYIKAALYDYQFSSKKTDDIDLENDSDFSNPFLKLLYDDVIFIGLTTNRTELYNRIDARVDGMVIDLIDEVKPFYLEQNYSKSLMTGIGYKELYDFFSNKKSLHSVVTDIKKNSRNYAKRQYTWFLNQMNIQWFSVDYLHFKKTIDEVIQYIEERSKKK